MKHLFLLMILSLGLAACSHKPPKPSGHFFPINESVQPNDSAIQKTHRNQQAESQHHD